MQLPLAGMVSEADIDLSVVTKYFIFQVGRWRRYCHVARRR